MIQFDGWNHHHMEYEIQVKHWKKKTYEYREKQPLSADY